MTLQLTCQICGNPLIEPRWRLVGVCANPKCLHAWTRRLQASKQAEMLKQKQQRQKLADTYLNLQIRQLGINTKPGEILAVVVPANLRQIVTLTERRKRPFRSHLRQSLRQAVSLQASSSHRASLDEQRVSPAASSLMLDPLLGRGCATCRGRCCNGGWDRAYQDAATLESYMHRHPGERPRHILENYLSRMPKRTFKESCVYHTEAGCVLPREMRSPICNEFYCPELRDFHRQFPRGFGGQIIYLAIEGTRLIRAEPLVAEEAGRR
jgi:hypothetical protein